MSPGRAAGPRRPALPAPSLALALVGLGLGLVLGACGSDPETPSQPPAELLARAAANPAVSAEASIDLDAVLRGDSLLAGPSAAELEGPYALDAGGGLPSFEFELDAEVAGFGVDAELVSTGEDAYVVFFGENYRVGPERVAALERGLRAAREQGGSPSLELDVASWFRNPRYAGGEEVAGTEAERIVGTLDARAAATEVSGLAAALGAPSPLREIAAGAGRGPVEAWVAYEDDTIRRLRARLPFAVPPDRRDEARGIGGGTISLDAEISEVGTEVSVEPPEGGGFQPVEQLLDRLRSLADLAL